MDLRRLLILATTAALTAFLAACDGTDGLIGPNLPPPDEQEPPPPGPVAPEVAEFVDLVNAHRTSMGLDALTWDDEVAAVAQAHSEDMVARGFFDHTNPDGESPFDRLNAAGIIYLSAGENIAYGYPTAESVLAAWLASSGHRANIENTNYTHHGVGLVGTHWTHVFVRKPTI